ncbi:MAG: hypothetical protein ACRD9Q_04120 [Nitrososphaeraceae archaeon]
MSVEWIVTGVILLGGMAVAGISLYIKRRREAQAASDLSLTDTGIQSDLTDIEKDDET